MWEWTLFIVKLEPQGCVATVPAEGGSGVVSLPAHRGWKVGDKPWLEICMSASSTRAGVPRD